MPRWKKSKGTLAVIVVVLLGLAEGVAQYIDASTHFTDRVLQALSAFEASRDPIPQKEGLPWPVPWISVRIPETDKERPEYRIGDQVIRGATGNFLTQQLARSQVPPGTRSIFIVGESVALGYPYPYEESFGAKLEAALGNEGYRVFNASQVSWPTAYQVPLVKRVVWTFQPAALVILMGNNEWARWQTHGQKTMPPLVLETLRTMSHSSLLSAALAGWLGYLIHHQDELRAKTNGFRLHAEMYGADYALEHPAERYGSFDAPAWRVDRKRFLDAFENHLSQMLELARADRIRVILMTMPFNYRLSPAWKNPQPESYDPATRDVVRAAIARAGALVKQGDCASALKELRAAREKDPEPPILSYLEGQCLEKAGQFRAAEAAYARARENVIGNLGAMQSINDRIKSVASRYGVELLDLVKLFDDFEHKRGRYFNEELIGDDCHPTPLASSLISSSLGELISRKRSSQR